MAKKKNSDSIRQLIVEKWVSMPDAQPAEVLKALTADGIKTNKAYVRAYSPVGKVIAAQAVLEAQAASQVIPSPAPPALPEPSVEPVPVPLILKAFTPEIICCALFGILMALMVWTVADHWAEKKQLNNIESLVQQQLQHQQQPKGKHHE